MKTILKYLALTIAFAFLASGTVVSAFMDVYAQAGMNLLWLLLPVTLLFMAAVAVDVLIAIPRLLCRQKYLLYCLVILATSYAASITAIFMEYAVRRIMDLPPRVNDIGSPWVYVDAFSDSMLLMLILLGIGARALHVRWAEEAERERVMAGRLTDYINEVRHRLDPAYIVSSLENISDSLQKAPAEVASRIRKLCDYLRRQLYELPSPSVMPDCGNIGPDYSALTNFIVGRKYRWVRHAIFQVILLIISFGTNFNSPDRPDFANRFGGFVAMYLILDILTYINVLWLSRRFRRHRSLRKYMIDTGILLAAVIVPLIITEIATYDQNPYDKQLPVVIMVIMTIGTMLTLFFFIGGTAAIMIHQDWIIGKRRMMLLHAETVRQEYSFLRKQINPHFLFNVLNNAGILSVEEPEEAARMLAELRKLVEYQFSETDNSTTTLRREIGFLNSYLALEGTRTEPFCFEISCHSEIDDAKIDVPTLLFIPFVENAVKHGSEVDGRRTVKVTFSESDGRLEFRCENTYRERKSRPDRPGGLGVPNTLRRLNLLFGDNYSYSTRTDGNCHIVELRLPLQPGPHLAQN